MNSANQSQYFQYSWKPYKKHAFHLHLKASDEVDGFLAQQACKGSYSTLQELAVLLRTRDMKIEKLELDLIAETQSQQFDVLQLQKFLSNLFARGSGGTQSANQAIKVLVLNLHAARNTQDFNVQLPIENLDSNNTELQQQQQNQQPQHYFLNILNALLSNGAVKSQQKSTVSSQKKIALYLNFTKVDALTKQVINAVTHTDNALLIGALHMSFLELVHRRVEENYVKGLFQNIARLKRLTHLSLSIETLDSGAVACAPLEQEEDGGTQLLQESIDIFLCPNTAFRHLKKLRFKARIRNETLILNNLGKFLLERPLLKVSLELCFARVRTIEGAQNMACSDCLAQILSSLPNDQLLQLGVTGFYDATRLSQSLQQKSVQRKLNSVAILAEGIFRQQVTLEALYQTLVVTNFTHLRTLHLDTQVLPQFVENAGTVLRDAQHIIQLKLRTAYRLFPGHLALPSALVSYEEYYSLLYRTPGSTVLRNGSLVSDNKMLLTCLLKHTHELAHLGYVASYALETNPEKQEDICITHDEHRNADEKWQLKALQIAMHARRKLLYAIVASAHFVRLKRCEIYYEMLEFVNG